MQAIFRGWIVHVGTVQISEYVLTRRKPDVYTTPAVCAATGEPTTLYATGAPWFFKYCKDGFERMMGQKLALGSAARMDFALNTDTIEALPTRPSPWLGVQ